MSSASSINSGAIGKALIIAVLMMIPGTLVAGLLGWLIVALWNPAAMVYLYVAGLVLLFILGTLTAGFAAARFEPAHPFLTAALAGAAFEVLLLMVTRQASGFMAIAIAIGLATLLAMLGAWLRTSRFARR